jgi:hypothetical protein
MVSLTELCLRTARQGPPDHRDIDGAAHHRIGDPGKWGRLAVVPIGRGPPSWASIQRPTAALERLAPSGLATSAAEVIPTPGFPAAVTLL